MTSFDVSENAGLPPGADTPKDDAGWQRWFYTMYDCTQRDGARFPKFTIVGEQGEASFTPENLWFRAVTLNASVYVNHASDNGNIIYGFGANVRRTGGNAFTVGGQFNAIGGRQAGASVFGIATEAWGEEGFASPIIAAETSVVSFSGINLSRKFGHDVVFKDRFDGTTTIPNGISSDKFNYNSHGVDFTSQSRSATGEKCGWSRGISFLGACLDAQTPPAWSATQTYDYGWVVTSGGRSWQAIAQSLNQVPAAPSAFWAQHTPAGTAALGIGIDFVSIDAGSLARISSAIRLRDGMKLHWEVTGTVGSYGDTANGLMVLVDNNGTRKFSVDYTTGLLWFGYNAVAPGGGAAAVIGTIGGGGPAVAAQFGWRAIADNAGTLEWIPTWR